METQVSSPIRFEQLEERFLLSGAAFQQLLPNAQLINIDPAGSVIVDGAISNEQDLHLYSFTTKAKGDLLIDLASHNSGLDPLLEIYNENGTRIRFNHENKNRPLDTLRLQVTSGQTYYVLTGGQNSTSGTYKLTLTSEPKDDYGDSFADAGNIYPDVLGDTVTPAKIDFLGDVDVFKLVSPITGQMGVDLTVRGNSSDLDPEISIYNSDGVLIAHDDNSGDNLNAALVFEAMEGETYYIKTEANQNASQGYYHISLAPADPSPAPDPGTTVVGRYIFYNNSAWDGNDASPNALDDGAIDPSKSALLDGQTATFTNYISYFNGINGIMIDITNLANASGISASDFTFSIGNNDNPDTWITGPSPSSVTVREGAGADGSDRVTLTFADTDAYNSNWMQITVLATENTGLVNPDVFYFGLAIGESGDNASDTFVTYLDRLGCRNNRHNASNPAPIDDVYDFNRDRYVDLTDWLIARSCETSALNCLTLITLSSTNTPELSESLFEMKGALTKVNGKRLRMRIRKNRNRKNNTDMTTDPSDITSFDADMLTQVSQTPHEEPAITLDQLAPELGDSPAGAGVMGSTSLSTEAGFAQGQTIVSATPSASIQIETLSGGEENTSPSESSETSEPDQNLSSDLGSTLETIEDAVESETLL
jgi:hypothetical protein